MKKKAVAAVVLLILCGVAILMNRDWWGVNPFQRVTVGDVVLAVQDESGRKTVADDSGTVSYTHLGYGTAVSKGLSFGNSVAKVGHKYGTKIRQKFRDWTGSENSTENKAIRRSAMAENMYGQMLYVSNYMKEEGSTDPKEQLFSVGENSASKVSKQMNYLDMMSTTLSYQFSKMLGSENQDDLLDLMSSAFSREG